MIDIEKEIEEYCAVDLVEDLKQKDSPGQGELIEAIKGFSNVFKRIGKEQYKSSQQLEEIVILLEEYKKTDQDLQDIQQEAKIKSKEVEGLLGALLELVDYLEDIYIYAQQSGQELLKEQVSMQWRKAVQLLETQGITLTQGVGQYFNVNLHKAREVKEQPEYPHGYILKVTKNGYMHKGKVIRKAEVIVNKKP